VLNNKAAKTALKGAVLIGACAVSAVLGGTFSRNLGVSTNTLSYADFISIMLTACSVLLALVTIILAVLGFLGWNAIANGVRNRTEQFLDQGFQHGSHLYAMVEAKVNEIMFEGVNTVEVSAQADDTAPEEGDGG
jgi:ABC-type dipeptide/oligopeptide/nickel transport system permease subunit